MERDVNDRSAQAAPERLRLPRGTLIVRRRETVIAAVEAALVGREPSIGGSLSSRRTTETAARVETSSLAEAAADAGRLVVATIVPLEVVWVLRLELLEEVGNVLLRLNENLAEVLADILVAVVVEGGGLTGVADTRGATDAVDVLGDAVVLSRRQVVVDDVLDVGDIETTSGHASSDEDGAATGAEGAPARVREIIYKGLGICLQRILALTLSAVAVDGGYR